VVVVLLVAAEGKRGLTIDAAVAPAVEGPVCGAEATDGCRGDAAGAAGRLFRVDAGTV